MLEAYLAPEPRPPDINIRQLMYQPPLPSGECMFDPDEELSEHQRQKCFEALRYFRSPSLPLIRSNQPSLIKYCQMAPFMKLLFPDRINEMEFDKHLLNDLSTELLWRMEGDVDLTAFYKRKIISVISNVKLFFGFSKTSSTDFVSPWNASLNSSLDFAVAIKSLFPHEKIAIDSKVLEEICDGMRKIESTKDFIEIATQVYLLSPALRHKIGLDQRRLQEGLEFLHARARVSLKEKHWQEFIEIASDIRILFPDAKLPMLADKEIWLHLKDYFEVSSKWATVPALSQFSCICETAVRLKILAAEKVLVTDQGIQIIMPPKTSKREQEHQPLPIMPKIRVPKN